jgi:cell wall-associated NlpC family hydrolase
LSLPRTERRVPPRRQSAPVVAAAALLALAAHAAPALAQPSVDESQPAPSGTTGSSGTAGAGGPARPADGVPALSEPDLHLTPTQKRRLQRRVHVRADGAFGRRSRNALERWERSAALAADGRADTIVLSRMGIPLTSQQAAQAAGMSVPPSGSAQDASGGARQAVDAAVAQVGTPYSTGGEQPGGFDCSGLTSWAFGQAGVTLPRTSFDQFGVGTAVQRDDIRAGDLVFFDSAGPGASDVGIATSATRTVSATSHGVMQHATFDTYWGGHYVGARRVPAG